MPFDSFYLNPRKVMVHGYTGETDICSDDDGSQHREDHGLYELDDCEDCEGVVMVCADCNRCVSCCPCGNYHSIDCDWPL